MAYGRYLVEIYLLFGWLNRVHTEISWIHDPVEVILLLVAVSLILHVTLCYINCCQPRVWMPRRRVIVINFTGPGAWVARPIIFDAKNNTICLAELTMSAPTTTAASKRTQLPGFGRPLNYVPQKDDPDYTGPLFPNALSNLNIDGGCIAYFFFVPWLVYAFLMTWLNRLPLTTLREFTMLRFMNIITDKPDWHVKVDVSLYLIGLILDHNHNAD